MNDARAVRRAGAVMVVLVLVWGYAWMLGASTLQLGERPNPIELSGMILIGIALALVSWDTIRRHRPVEPLMGQE